MYKSALRVTILFSVLVLFFACFFMSALACPTDCADETTEIHIQPVDTSPEAPAALSKCTHYFTSTIEYRYISISNKSHGYYEMNIDTCILCNFSMERIRRLIRTDDHDLEIGDVVGKEHGENIFEEWCTICDYVGVTSPST